MVRFNEREMIKDIITLIALILILMTRCACGQEGANVRTRAQEMLDRYEYRKAASLFESLVNREKAIHKDVERLAECYFYLQDYELAENLYARVQKTDDFEEQSVLNYAEVLKMQGKYKEAKIQYQRYALLYNESEKIIVAMAGADSAQAWLTHPTAYSMVNQQEVNTKSSEYVSFSSDLGIYYVSDANAKIYSDEKDLKRAYSRLYGALRDSVGSLYSPKRLLTVVNQSKYHVGDIVISKDAQTMYVTRTYTGVNSEINREKGRRYRQYNLELILYKKVNGRWEESSFPYNNTQAYSLGHAALSEDENILYYVSNMPGGKGGKDIWFSERLDNGSWSEPINAGTEINSTGDEMFPRVDGDELYFSSNGFAGMGGLDIFKARGMKSDFCKRENLRFPINSASDDFSFVLYQKDSLGKVGYISSNRPGGKGGDDIYRFNLEHPKFTTELKGIVLNKETGEQLVEASVVLYDKNKQLLAKKKSDQHGRFFFSLAGEMDYTIQVEKEGFLVGVAEVRGLSRISQDSSASITLRLEPVIQVGHKFILENLYYNLDAYALQNESKRVLDRLVYTLRDNPTLGVELSSHTDSRGSAKYNLRLSQKRGSEAVDYLVNRGIDRGRITLSAYGEERLLNHCVDGVKCSEAEHQKNRRTEIEILEFREIQMQKK